MEERDKLRNVLDKLGDDQIRMLTGLAEVLLEENQVDSTADTGDIGQRYAEFKRWCETIDFDLASLETWLEESPNAKANIKAATQAVSSTQ